MRLPAGVTVKDYVRIGLRGNSEFGLRNYTIPKDTRLDKPRNTMIKKSTIPGYLEYEYKKTRGIPGSAKYNTCVNIINPTRKSDLEKAKRKSLYEQTLDRERMFPKPAPNAFSPSYKLVLPRNMPCYKQTAP